jgi:trans-aconitate 2-methyltransferase
VTPPGAGTAPRDWDAVTYHRVSHLQLAWGLEVLDRLPLNGDETVLDAGCGTGRVTEHLIERLPHGRVIAVDGAPSMVEKARETVGDRADVRQVDLSELTLDQPVDAIFSNAVFHWIADHDLLFRLLYEALRPGGRLLAQCGGTGNVARLAEAIAEVREGERFAQHFRDWRTPWNFQGPEATAERLDRAGFTEIDSGLERKRVRPDDPHGFLKAVSLGPLLDELPEGDHEPFVSEVADRMPDPLTLEYVRLNISARRPA